MRETFRRRAFLQSGALVLAGLAAGPRLFAGEPGRTPKLRLGLVTDIHYAEKPTRINRYYRESLTKLREAVDVFNDAEPDFVAQLGDLIDAGGSLEQELAHLRGVEAVLDRLACDRRYVLGNHCVDGLTKEEFVDHTTLTTTHQAFSAGGVCFITLDSCYRADGEPYGRGNFDWTDANIPADQLDWLARELRASGEPVVILAHQRLDEAGDYSVRNAPAVREVLEAAGNVLAVFQGHYHREDYQQIAGIHYCTQVALVEGSGEANNAYSLLSIYDDTSMRIEGFRRQGDRDLTPAQAP